MTRRRVFAGLIVVTAVMLVGNGVTRKGGILDDPILDPTNPLVISDRRVHALVPEGLAATELVPFVLHFPGGIAAPSDLRRIQRFTSEVRAALPGAVLSLATIPDVHGGDALRSEPYVPAEIPNDYDLAAWKRRVAAEPSLFGTFMGRDFEFALVARFPPTGYDEIEEYRRTVGFLEGRRIPWWEWLYKSDVDVPPDVSVGGWIVGRGTLDQGFNVDVLLLVGLGVLLTVPIFTLVLRSFRLALLGVGVVVVTSVVWTRGTIGVLDLAGWPMRERIYTLLAYTTCLVQGSSFALHKLWSFRRAALRGTAPRAAWHVARDADGPLLTTAVVSLAGFATLVAFEVRAIREVAVLSAAAVLYVLALATIVLPVVAEAWGVRLPRSMPAASRRSRGLATAAFAALGCGVAGGASRGRAWVAAVAVAALAGVAFVSAWPGGMLAVKTFPLRLIAGTHVARTAAFMNEPGRPGAGALEFLLAPADSSADGIYQPRFLADVRSYVDALAALPEARAAISIVPTIARVSEALHGSPVPATADAARDAFALVETTLDPEVGPQLFFRDGIRVSLTHAAGDTSGIAALVTGAERLARERFPSIRVLPFGRSALFGEVDRYVRSGKPRNVANSLWVVVALCAFALARQRRRVAVRTGAGIELASWRGGLVMTAPLVFASAVTVLAMILLAIPLDVATAALTALGINAAIDFAVYYVHAYQERLAATGEHATAVAETTARVGPLILADTALNALCFLPLAFSRFEPLVHVAGLMLLMLTASAAGALLIQPVLLPLAVRRPRVPSAHRVAARRAAASVMPLTGALAVVLTAMPAHADDAAEALMADVFRRYRSVGTERQRIDVVVVPTAELPLDRATVEALRSRPSGVIAERAVLLARYGGDGRDEIAVAFTALRGSSQLWALGRRGPHMDVDERWLFAASMPDGRRVAASQPTRLGATDVTFDDLLDAMGDPPGRHRYERLRTETIGGRRCSVVRSTRLTGTRSAGVRLFWIDDDRRFPIRIDHLGADGGVRRTILSFELADVAPGVTRAGLIEVRDLTTRRSTVLLTRTRQVGTAIDAAAFEPAALLRLDAKDEAISTTTPAGRAPAQTEGG